MCLICGSWHKVARLSGCSFLCTHTLSYHYDPAKKLPPSRNVIPDFLSALYLCDGTFSNRNTGCSGAFHPTIISSCWDAPIFSYMCEDSQEHFVAFTYHKHLWLITNSEQILKLALWRRKTSCWEHWRSEAEAESFWFTSLISVSSPRKLATYMALNAQSV